MKTLRRWSALYVVVALVNTVSPTASFATSSEAVATVPPSNPLPPSVGKYELEWARQRQLPETIKALKDAIDKAHWRDLPLTREIANDPKIKGLIDEMNRHGKAFLDEMKGKPGGAALSCSGKFGPVPPSTPGWSTGLPGSMNRAAEEALARFNSSSGDAFIRARNAFAGALRNSLKDGLNGPNSGRVVNTLAGSGLSRYLPTLGVAGLLVGGTALANDFSTVGQYVSSGGASSDGAGATVVSALANGSGVVAGAGGLYASAASAAAGLGVTLPALPAVPAVLPGLAATWGGMATTAAGGTGLVAGAAGLGGTVAGAVVSGALTSAAVGAVAAAGYGAGYALGNIELGDGRTVGDWMVDNSALNSALGGSTTESRETELRNLMDEMKDNVSNFDQNIGKCSGLSGASAASCAKNNSDIAEAAKNGTCSELPKTAQKMACESLKNVACTGNESRRRAKEKLYGEETVEAIRGACEPAPRPTHATLGTKEQPEDECQGQH